MQRKWRGFHLTYSFEHYPLLPKVVHLALAPPNFKPLALQTKRCGGGQLSGALLKSFPARIVGFILDFWKVKLGKGLRSRGFPNLNNPNHEYLLVCETLCQHMARFTGTELTELLGAPATSDIVRQRFRCSVCGSRLVSLRVIFAGDTSG